MTQLVRGVAARGHHVTVFGTLPLPADVDLGENVSFELVDIPKRPVSFYRRFDAAIRDRVAEFDAFDVVHCYQMELLSAITRIAAETSARTLVTLQAYGAVCPKNDLLFKGESECRESGYLRCARCVASTAAANSLCGLAKRVSYRLEDLHLLRKGRKRLDAVDGFHTYTPELKSHYAEFDFPPEKVTVVDNVLDEQFLVAHESGFAEPYDLLYAGRLSAEKGVDRLVPLVAALRERTDHEFRLTVAGEGPLEDDLRAQVEERGVGDAVAVAGHVPYGEMPALYATHDVFVYPGVWDEPFGRVFMEAMATGTPVVATDVGSVADIVGDAGVVCESSVDALAATLADAVEGDDLAAMSARSERQVAQHRPSVVVPQFEQLYRSL